MAATAEDLARLLVSIEFTQKQAQKQLAAIAKAGADTAGNIEKRFQKANDNVGRSFQNGGKQVERSLGAQRAAVSNLSFQLNDIAMGLASGTSPFTIMVQQGSQVSQALQGSGGLVGAVKTLGGAFAQMVNPVSLASFALIGLVGYAIQYFTSVDDGANKSDKALKAHVDLIAAVAKEWGDAVPALKAYAEAAERAQNVAQLREATNQHIDKIFAEAREQVKGLSVDITDVVNQLRAAGASEEGILKIQVAFNKLKVAIDGGKDSTKETKELTNALITEWLNTGVSSAQNFAGSVNKIAEAFANVAKEAEEARKQQDRAIAERLMNDPRTWRSYGRTDQNADGTIQGASTVLPDNGPTPERRPLIELDGLGESAKKVKNTFDGLDGTIDRYVDQIVKAESGGRANAKNPNSSATGLGQFIESTWLSLFRQHFPDRAKNMSDATILALRTDADISRELIKEYARQNAEILRQAGVSVNEAALHLAHFLGPQGAIAVLQAKAGTLAKDVLSASAVAANPTILGNGATVDDVIRYAEGRAGAYDKMRESAKALKVEQRELNKETREFTNIGVDVVGGFINDLRRGVSAAEALRNALNRVLDSVIQIGLQNLFGGIGGGGKGGLLGGAIIPGILHSGGVAGRDGYGHGRAVSPSVFAGAKRYHTGGIAGLQPGEVPAILQRGEVVLPRGTKAAQPQAIHVTVGASVDSNGNLLPFVESVSRGQVAKAAPGIVSAANQNVVPTMAKFQNQKAGGDWRNG
ncbi:phage tail length tape measure family protein [Shinella sp. BYT-45]|uniref:phage tail length tape measure family protein n=1 Tax=Shinella sp. BYT-45 TaxID=3377377 RepID=UPI003980F0FE